MASREAVCERCLARYPVWMGSCPSCAREVGREAPAWSELGDAVRSKNPRRGDTRVYCPHCGMLYDAGANACPRCPPATPDAARGGHCPRCGGAMAEETMATAVLDRCRACGGLWFDRGEVVRVLDLRTGPAVAERERKAPRSPRPAEAPGPDRDAVRYLPCLRCGERMARRLVAPRTGIVVDLCRAHGMWFDAGELERFREFVEGGGLAAAREQETKDAAKRRQAAQERRADRAAIQGLGPEWDVAGHLLGGLGGGFDP